VGETREIILPLRSAPGSIRRVTQVRGKLLVSSLASVKGVSRFDDYMRVCPPPTRAYFNEALAQEWAPIDVALGHYLALDRLELTPREQMSMGEEVARRVQVSILGTLARLSTSAGVTPWTALAQFQKLWDRIFDAGDVQVIKTGRKDAIVEAYANPLFASRFFCNACRGHVVVATQLFCTRSFARDFTKENERITIRVSWA
jgi:hypothetical protein